MGGAEHGSVFVVGLADIEDAELAVDGAVDEALAGDDADARHTCAAGVDGGPAPAAIDAEAKFRTAIGGSDPAAAVWQGGEA